MKYESSFKVLLQDFFGERKKLKAHTLSLAFSFTGEMQVLQFEEGLNKLLEGKLICEASNPLAPVFQVLEAMSLFDVIFVESMRLDCIGKTFYNLITLNTEIKLEWLEVSIDNKISYLYEGGH